MILRFSSSVMVMRYANDDDDYDWSSPLFHDEQSHHQNTQMHRFLVINKLLDNMKSIWNIMTIKLFDIVAGQSGHEDVVQLDYRSISDVGYALRNYWKILIVPSWIMQINRKCNSSSMSVENGQRNNKGHLRYFCHHLGYCLGGCLYHPGLSWICSKS